jgi:hypothetical protein
MRISSQIDAESHFGIQQYNNYSMFDLLHLNRLQKTFSDREIGAGCVVVLNLAARTGPSDIQKKSTNFLV